MVESQLSEKLGSEQWGPKFSDSSDIFFTLKVVTFKARHCREYKVCFPVPSSYCRLIQIDGANSKCMLGRLHIVYIYMYFGGSGDTDV